MITKKEVLAWLEGNASDFTGMSDAIWARPELGHREFFASQIQSEYLAKEGFRITWDIGNLRTAFIAEWGSGQPVIGFLGEFDALANLSQQNAPAQEPVVAGAPGHGCGHNLLGTGCLAAAVAVKRWMEALGIQGTVRYYACPSEENTFGKTFMARAGAFDDLKAAFNYHPSYLNYALKGSLVGVYEVRFRFHGKASHAGESPQMGRSALDAVELMNVGVNYLREHVSSTVRLHYVITRGGDLPNIVPEEAEVWYFIRAHDRNEHEEVINRVRKIAQGSALMTETTFEEIPLSACSSLLNNRTLADLQYAAMQEIGPIHFTEDEKTYAQAINDHYPEATVRDVWKSFGLPKQQLGKPLYGENYPSLDEGRIESSSTDVGDVSWITPLSMLSTACWASGAPGHSWGVVATGAMSIGHKGMLHAAKVMALAAMDLFTNPQYLEKAREEFLSETQNQPYRCPLPDTVIPPRYNPPEG
jgi:aminobenzoyl-glutamate utilization protein B